MDNSACTPEFPSHRAFFERESKVKEAKPKFSRKFTNRLKRQKVATTTAANTRQKVCIAVKSLPCAISTEANQGQHLPRNMLGEFNSL
jgi:hypothetical protein